MAGDEQRRRECWAEFCAAVEAALAGDNEPAKRYVAAHPAGADELRAYVRACLKGRTRRGERFERRPDGQWRAVKAAS